MPGGSPVRVSRKRGVCRCGLALSRGGVIAAAARQRHQEQTWAESLSSAPGNPCFCTDTAAALLAHEIGAEVTLKAPKVGGIYDGDPKKNPQVKHFAEISHFDALQKRLKRLNQTAFSL